MLVYARRERYGIVMEIWNYGIMEFNQRCYEPGTEVKGPDS